MTLTKQLIISLWVGLWLGLSGCSAISIAKALLGDKPSLAVEAQVGDREANLAAGNTSAVGDIELEKGSVSVDNSNKQSKVGSAESVTINEGNNWLVVLLVIVAIAGWCLPSPAELFRKIKK